MKKSILITLYVILVLAVIAGVVVIVRLTNGFTDDFKTFYVTDANNKIYATSDRAVLPREEKTVFKVRYTFEKITDISTDYSVKVVTKSTDKTKFTYTVDGEEREYVSDTDVTSAFKLEKSEDSFIITMPCDMQEVLEMLHAGQAVELSEEIDIASESYFDLVVTSYNEKSKVVISLCAGEAKVKGITLNTGGNIVFR